MVITLLVPVRAFFGLKDLITTRHLENMAKITLATGLMVGYSYGIEFFMAWYSRQPVRAVRPGQPGAAGRTPGRSGS